MVLGLLGACGGQDETATTTGAGGGFGAPTPQVVPQCPGYTPDGSAASRLVLVSLQGHDQANCGTTSAAACGTIQAGIDQCASAGCSVLVRHGLYATTATLRLREGVAVHGSCRFDGEADRGYRTLIQASPAPGSPAVLASGLQRYTPLSGLVVLGKDETAAGSASIAAFGIDSPGLTLYNTILVAGHGGAGADGGATPAAPNSAAGQQGAPTTGAGGGQGAGGCRSTSPGQGGSGATWQENDIHACGLWCSCTGSGGAYGARGSGGGPGSGGPGGNGGGPGGTGYGCGSGETVFAPSGRDGDAGAGASCASVGGVASADVVGTLSNTGWTGGSGGEGSAGDTGGGGGGGGAGGLCARRTSAFGWAAMWGQPGGGGGAGGCGAGGGAGGQQGGASIALAINGFGGGADARTMVVPGIGGAGGPGGAGGDGAAGGAGGRGAKVQGAAACTAFITNDVGYGGLGGSGGRGGSGGGGSGGAGGNGGPSIGMAIQRGTYYQTPATVYPANQAGSGGMGGAGGAGGADNPCVAAAAAGGRAGASQQVMVFD